MELNATNVEVIVGTIIEEANNGKIDLNGFSSFWTFIKQKVLSYLGSIEFQIIEPACQRTTQCLILGQMLQKFKNFTDS